MTGDKDRYYILIFYSCLALNIYLSFVGIDNTLSEYHSFRQAQTTINVYYMDETGFSIDYLTPVMGPPWKIPFEFPLYQWGAYLLYNAGFGLSLETSGRLVSLLFFYLSLSLFNLILKNYLKERKYRLVILSLTLIFPVYIYWSRAFMIESTALFFSALYLHSIIDYINKEKAVYIILAVLSGALAGVEKSTTYIVFLIPALIILTWKLRKGKQGAAKFPAVFIAAIIVAILIPLAATACWSSYAGAIRDMNPLADKAFEGGSLSGWLIGTFSQRLYVYPALSSVFLILWFFSKKMIFRKEILTTFLFFSSGPLIFTNLFLVHDYYYYSNAVFLITCFGFIIASIIESGDKRKAGIAAYLALPMAFIIFLTIYFNLYFPVQSRNNISAQNIGEEIRKHTGEGDIVLIYGYDWSPEIPYYAKRKCVMDRYFLPLNDTIMKEVIGRCGKGKIKAMLIRGYKLWEKDFISERVKYFGLLQKPVYKDTFFGELYVKETP